MAMNSAMDLEVQNHYHNESVIYDLFHVVAKFGRVERVEQANAMRRDKAAKKGGKVSLVLLRTPENLKGEQRTELDALLELN